jgi:hypothetical protein
MEHRPGVQQFEVGVEASPLTLQRAEQEHTSGVVEQQIVLDVSDVLGDLPNERRVWYRDTRDRLRCHAFSVGRLTPQGPCPMSHISHRKRHMVAICPLICPPTEPSCSWCSTG